MVQPGTISEHDTPGSPIEAISDLIRDFQKAPFDCFNENELHAKFYSMCRGAFPECSTTDGRRVAAFRHRYETIWRYRRDDRFSQRLRDTGSTATFDFAVLRRHFINRSPYIIVANKHDQRRVPFRCSPKFESSYSSSVVQCAIELKMTHLADDVDTIESVINRLEDRMLASCCKLASEGVRQAYIIGLSHGPQPDLDRAHSMVSSCLQLHQARYPRGSLRVVVATPTKTVLGGDWPGNVVFPNVVVRNGWPVSNDERADSGTAQ